MDAAAVAAQAELLERAWSPPAAPPSGRLTAAIFATLRGDPELLALAERGRSGGVFGVLGRVSVRDGRAERSLLALGHPGGAWLEWLA